MLSCFSYHLHIDSITCMSINFITFPYPFVICLPLSPQAIYFDNFINQNQTNQKPVLNSKKKKKSSISNSSTLFTREPEFCYEDFSTQMAKMANLRPLPLHDYSWELHGYLVANMYYVESAPFLDNKFKVARSLTYNT